MDELTQKGWYALCAVLPRAGLVSLVEACEGRSPELVQGSVVRYSGGGVCKACAVGYAMWKGATGLAPCEVEYEFMIAVSNAARSPGAPSGCVSRFLTWFDYGDRAAVLDTVATETRAWLAATEEGHES